MNYFCGYCTEVFSNSLGILCVLYNLCPSKLKHSNLLFHSPWEKEDCHYCYLKFRLVWSSNIKIAICMYKLSEERVKTISHKARSSLTLFLNSQTNCTCSKMFQLHNVLMLVIVLNSLRYCCSFYALFAILAYTAYLKYALNLSWPLLTFIALLLSQKDSNVHA